MCESDSPERGRNPVCRGLVPTASLEFANRLVSNAIALPPGGPHLGALRGGGIRRRRLRPAPSVVSLPGWNRIGAGLANRLFGHDIGGSMKGGV